MKTLTLVREFGVLPFVPHHLSGRILFAPPEASAVFLLNDLLVNGTCSVTGGSIAYWGAQTEKIANLISYKIQRTNCFSHFAQN